MAIKTLDDGKKQRDPRKERLSAQLRANLARRKAQSRAKRAGDADERPEGLGGGQDKDNIGGDS
jgi:hypothetical protein